METLESSRVCRLCGKKSGISINLFDKNENHVRKINAVLPIMVHEMDLLPKHMCHRCSYKLEEFHRFYVDCLKTDANLKSQLSWMKKKDSKEKAGVPMVQIENVKIKVEPPDCNDVYRLEPIVDNVNYINAMKSMTFPINRVGTDEIRNGITYAAYARCNCYCDKKDQSKERNVSNQYRKPVVGFERNDKRLSAASTILEKSTRFSSSEDIVERHRLLETRNYACPKNMGKKSSLSAQSKGIELSFFKKKLLFDCKIQDRNDTIDDASKSTIVRNLRPRKHFVNYLDWKRKAPSDVSLLRLEGKSEDMNEKTYFSPLVKSDTVRIKTEEREEFGGRTLRPRKRIIDYLETKRKNNPVVARDRDKYRSTEIGTRTYDNVSGNNNVCESRLRTVQEVRTIVEDDIKLGIKQEIFTNLDKILLKKSTTTTHRVLETNKKDALPDNAIDRVNTRLTNYAKSNCIQNRSNFQLGDNNNYSKDRESNNNNNNNNNNNREDALNHSSCVKRIPAKRLKYNNNYNNKLRSLKDIKKSKFNCNKASAKRIIAPIYSNLRSMCIQLRNGKVKRFEDPQTSVRRLKKKIRCVTVKNRSIGRNLLNVINKTVGAKKISTSVKLNEDAIKHYCEKCSLSFVNKEMFKLHVCYQ